MTAWATLAGERADRLEEQIQGLVARRRLGRDPADALVARLGKVRTDHLYSRRGVLGRAGERISGDEVNEAWNELHRIEIDIDRYEPYEFLHAEAKRHVQSELPADRAAKEIEDLEARSSDERALRMIQDAHWEAETRHESERQRQRGIVMLGGGLLAAAILVLCLQAFAFSSESFLPVPAETTSISATGLLVLTMVFGMLGGGLSALLSLYVSDKKFKNTMWFDPRPALTLVKVSVGLWSAVIGALAVGSGVLVGVYTTTASALLLAVLFGYGQQAVTKFMDDKAIDLAGGQDKKT